MISQYGFIVKAESYNYQQDKTTMNSEGFFTEVIGVGCDDEAILAAQDMIKNGIQVIELCGGFGPESADYIISKLDTEIPIGYVSFSKTENKKLEQIMSRS